MDKLKLVLILCLVPGILCFPAFALQTTNSINVTVTVQGAFNLTVNTDSFDFARMAPGQKGEMNRSEGVAVAASSGSGNPWYLKVSTTRPLTSGSNTIPNENFTWYGSSEGSGEWRGLNEKNMADQSAAAYVSSVDEADRSTRVTNKFKFRLHVPEDTKPGYYTTTVMFTMTE